MSLPLYESLAWLPAAPSDFAIRSRSLVSRHEQIGGQIKSLASYALDENNLNRLARVILSAAAKGLSLAPLTPFRLGILSNATTDFLVPALIASAARHGVHLECVTAGYGETVQAAVAPDSRINNTELDAVLIALDYRGYPIQASSHSDVAPALTQLEMIRAGIRKNSHAICIVQNLAPPVETFLGSLDKVVPDSQQSLVDAFNNALHQTIADSIDVLLDVSSLASIVGLSRWYSPEQWNLAKLPFSSTYLPLYAEHVVRIIAAIRGKSRRVLILDLDNTLWGGVIGDDGLEGIRVSPGDSVGEAYLSFQKYVLELRRRGVLLVVSSKNHDQTARLPFQKHPEMLLREEHLAIFQANWNDKATNIRAIADELSLGLDSMVFVDDNPAERAIVRQFLPQVAVPEMPLDPALYARTLSAAGYFEAITFSNEDARRAALYESNARRVALRQQVGDLGSYLRSLQMTITFRPVDSVRRARVTQLINKSNQYNLTTCRYTEAEVTAMEDDASLFTLQVSLDDVFGDNGMISVVICRLVSDHVWEIDTWLMSCRVLGRRVENAVLQELVRHAKASGVRILKGRYIKSDRNELVEDHYQKLGFTQISGHSAETLWELEVNRFNFDEVPMQIRRLSLDKSRFALSSC